MKLFFALIVLTSLNCIPQAKANSEREGGGGNAVVCFNQTRIGTGERSFYIVQEIKKNNNIIPDDLLKYIDSIEMYDLYDAKRSRGLDPSKPEIITINEDENYFEYFERLGSRFEKTNSRMQWILNKSKKLLPESNFVLNDYAVKYQNDLGNVTLPSERCLIITMAAQVNDGDYFEAHIDKRLFFHPKHTKQSQATLILHEMIYAYARKNNHKNSRATRNLVRFFIAYHKTINEMIVSKAINSLGFNDFIMYEDEPDHSVKEYMEYRNSNISKELVGIYGNLISLIMSEMYMHSNQHPIPTNRRLRILFKKIRIDYENKFCTISNDHASACYKADENMIDAIYFMKNALLPYMDETERWSLNTEIEYIINHFKTNTLAILSNLHYEMFIKDIKKVTNISKEDVSLLKNNFDFVYNDFVSASIKFDGGIRMRHEEYTRQDIDNRLYLLIPYRSVVVENGEVRTMEPLGLQNIIQKK